MFRMYMLTIDIIVAAIFIVPLLFLYNKLLFNSLKKTFGYIIIAIYFIAMYSLVGLPIVISLCIDFTHNFIPFYKMISDLKNSILNVILFIPLGVLLPILWDRYRSIKHTLVFSFCTTLLVEILQIFTYRTTDINDIITNVLGAIIGYLLAKWVTKGFNRYVIKNTKSTEIYLVIATVVFVMFFIYPFVVSVIWNIIL